MDIRIETGDFEDAAAVRRAVFMDEQGYENEFDDIDTDAACIHVTLYADDELAGCSRVFPEPLERAADPSAPTSPACELDDGVSPDETYVMGRVAVLAPGPCLQDRRSECDGSPKGRCQAHEAARPGVRDPALSEARLYPDRPRRLRRRGPTPRLDGKAAIVAKRL